MIHDDYATQDEVLMFTTQQLRGLYYKLYIFDGSVPNVDCPG